MSLVSLILKCNLSELLRKKIITYFATKSYSFNQNRQKKDYDEKY